MDRILVLTPTELLASKVTAYHQRRGKPKAGTDWRDIAMLLLTFPELKCSPGPVTDCLLAMSADDAILAVWEEFVSQVIELPDDDEF
jgi:hypothetical protein